MRDLEELVKAFKEIHRENLISVLLYGSSAIDNVQQRARNRNILVVLGRVTAKDLELARPAIRRWCELGNPIPVYMSRKELGGSLDVFPIEFTDMSRAKRILWGIDPFEGMEVSTENFRHQLEYELRSKMIRLRRTYLLASDDPARLANLMRDSLLNFAVLFRHLILLLGGQAEFDKRECIAKLAGMIGLDLTTLERVLEANSSSSEADRLFADYLEQIEKVIEAIDRLP
jgi:hypothetical protein